MFWLYGKVAAETGRRVVRSWQALLVLPAYPVILYVGAVLVAPTGMFGGILFSLLIAACWSSYLELISQAVSNARFRLVWSEFKRTFAVHFMNVISVMFVFWIIQLVSGPLTAGPRGPALAAIIGFAIAVMFNAVPELLYQGNSRSFALLVDSARFVTEHPVVWLLPNVVLAGLALWFAGGLQVTHPAQVLIAFGSTFSSPAGVVSVLLGGPLWTWPLLIMVAHVAMIFRGVLFRELSSGGGNARLRAFRARM